MAFWLASKREGQDGDWIMRFDPRFWTVNFPRPMVATVVSTGPDSLRVEASFLRKADLGGLIWDSEDRLDHPLLAYKADRDYAHTSLRFHWRSGGLIPLDAVNGPTLTIEGHDAEGATRTWYVRLWNYAEGSGEDAVITLPFSALEGGYALPADADPVWPGAIERMFISFAPPGYDAASTEPLATETEGWFELTELAADGERAMVEIGDIMMPPHGLAVATGFDDQGVQTPARLLRMARQLGYRGSLVHYLGMSHYFRLAASGGSYLAGASGDPLNGPTRAWHRAFFAAAAQMGFSPIASLSFELLDQHCPEAWKQRDHAGAPALTGWDPPSTLLSPANAAAMAWLRSAAAAFAALMKQAGAEVRFQIGEPWWWTFADGRICLYDDAAVSAFGGAPTVIADVRAALDGVQTALLDAAGTLLAEATSGLVAAVRDAVAPVAAEATLLIFTPTLLDPATPEMRRANLPLGWASPAFDRLQLEDYDWLTTAADGLRRSAWAEAAERLCYARGDTDYFAGFVPGPAQADLWRRIDAAIDAALATPFHELIVWALPQVARDGYVRLPSINNDSSGADPMQAFDDVSYPLALGRDTAVIPEFSTTIAVTASGFERRNSLWSDARLRFDVGPGVRSEAELGELIAFFRARRGPARGFRLRDPFDHSSNGMTGVPTPIDQRIGTGDGLVTDFALVKRYGEGDEAQLRRITRPEFETLLVSVDGALQLGNWTLAAGGMIVFGEAPPAGAAIHAGFLFDVPVRFAEDRLEVSGAAFAAGEAPSVPIVAVREAS